MPANAGGGTGPLLARRSFPLGRRGSLTLLILLAGVLSYQLLGLSLGDLQPKAGGRKVAVDFFAAALRPALDYEDPVPGADPFLLKILSALWRTLQFAAAGIALAIVGGSVLGFLASDSWWSRESQDDRPAFVRRLAPGLQWGTRLLIAGLRSVHELLWAVLFLTAMGVSSGAAVIAIALPYSGTLAKVYAEILDESSPRAADALRATGAGHRAVFLFGRLPRALPDLFAYSFYRFECAVRSATVLGFFGYETLGLHLRQSFNNLHYHETWTVLYVFVGVVLLLEGWSILLRQRFIA
ncbi:MAG: phosphonate transport system permease protein [Planctomycetota bacterium]|jgi:phosphonate transport system permease protein